MGELQKKGGKLLYDPDFLVHRRPRSSLKAFAKMLRTYGRGRAEQFRLHPTFGSALNFVPPLFLLYLATTAVLFPLSHGLGRLLSVLPLGFYFLAVLVQVGVLAAHGQVLRSLAAMPLIVLTHVLYGFGFWRGLFTTLKTAPDRQPVPVELEMITDGGETGLTTPVS